MFDFLKVSSGKKKQAPKRAKGRPLGGGTPSRGQLRIDKFVFNVRELNKKGFILDPYDKDVVISGQRFRFEIDAIDLDGEVYKGKAEAVVTKIVNNQLAAAFVSKFF